MSDKENGLAELRRCLAGKCGPIGTPSEIELLLSKYWGTFEGANEGGMAGHKILGRTEGMEWNPPHLTFNIERHGGIFYASVYAEIQSCTVDLNLGTATVAHWGRRQIRPRAEVVKTKPLAEEVASLILTRADDPRLRWKAGTKVQIDIARVIPATKQQTTSARRKRFRDDLKEALQRHGWRMTRANLFERP